MARQPVHLEQDGTTIYTPAGITLEMPTGTIKPAGIDMSDIPTSDPEVAGMLWSNAGTLTISAGPGE